MQDSEENLKKEKRNYAEEQLIKLGFLSKDNIEGYSKVEILSLIDYLIEIKEREEELIPKEKKQEFILIFIRKKNIKNLKRKLNLSIKKK